MTTHFSAVLFDLDGTLVDSENSIETAFNLVLSRHGFPKLKKGQLATFAGVPMETCYSHLGVPDSLIPEILKEHLAALASNLDLVKRFPDSQYVLNSLHRNELRVAVVTSSPRLRARQVLAQTKLAALVNMVVADGDASTSKPAPGPYLLAARKLGVAAKDCLVVGDGVTDLQAGHSAGMKTVWATFGFGAHQPTPIEPDYRISRLNGVLEIPGVNPNSS